jgi:hypothetical protein
MEMRLVAGTNYDAAGSEGGQLAFVENFSESDIENA